MIMPTDAPIRSRSATTAGRMGAGGSFLASGKRRMIAALLLAATFGGGFAATSLFNQYRFGFERIPCFHSFYLDSLIPFYPEWVWIYLFYYPFCFLPLLLVEVRHNPSVFMRTAWAFVLQFGVSFTFFVLLPLRMAHPSLPHGASAQIVAGFYRFDLGFNSFPSLHVTNITFVSLLFARLRGAWMAAPITVLAGLIALSTLFVKQHYVSDVLAGALLGWGSFSLAFSENLTLKRKGVQETCLGTTNKVK